MKQNYLKELMTALLLLCCTVASAADFEVGGLYYNILSSEDKTVELTGGSPSGELVIPSTVTYESVDYTVTEIAEIAFQFNKTMTSVTIPATIEYIRSAAFSDCSNVTAFNVAADNATYVSENGVIYTKDMSTIILCPNTTTGVYKIRANVSTIGECAFDGCTKIEKIIIPQSVSTIGQYAFANCELLTELTIPASVTSIDDYAFEDCTGLTSIVVDEGNSVYDSRGNCNAIIETASNTLITASKNTIIPEGVTSISDRAFYNCSGLTSIVIPNSVTSIDRCAFEGCTGLTSIEIPESVTSIGEYAFCACTGLTNIEIPSSVTSIGNYAFNNCTGLTSIVSHIAAEDLFAPGDYAFNGIDKDACTLYVPAGAKSTYAATERWKNFTNIVEFNGKCGDNAFWTLNEETGALTIFGEGAMYNYANDDANRAPWYSNRGSISSVTIEEGVTSISESAFRDCYNLTSIEIPSSVTSIGDYAFSSCTSLTSIEIPEGITSIGFGAFTYCYGLTSIEIPSSVTSIGERAFSNCTGLTSIVVGEGNSVYDSRGNCNAIIETASNTLIAGCKNTIIPEGVTSIGESAFFYCTGLTSIEIPSSVTSIGESAFSDCTGLTSIEIPSSVTSIGNYAFGACRGLTSIIVDEGNSVYDSRGNCNAIIETASNTLIAGCVNTIIPEGVTSIGKNAFHDCTGLTSIEIPSSVTSIGNCAFYFCYGLTSVEISEGVTNIGNLAFYSCSALTSIEIPSSVTSIGDGVFDDCHGLTSIVSQIAAEDLFAPGDDAFRGIDKNACTLYVPAGAKSTYAATEQWKDFTNIVEFNGKCGDNAFWTLDEGVLTIFGKGAMYNYANNSANRAPWYSNSENITSVTIEEDVTSIGNSAFDNCYNLTNIEIPSSVTSIGNYAFYDCTSLTSIEIPSSVTSIGYLVFYNCSGLTSIEIPSSVTSIGNGAFGYCDGLTSVEIPSSVTSISDYTFYGCYGLTSIEIPSSVTSIGKEAFHNCNGLRSIVSHIAAENLFAPGDNAFNGIYKDACTLYVPAGAKSTYAATEQWKDFTNIVEPYDLTVTAAGYATLYLGTAVEIPAGVEAYTAGRIEGDLLKMQAVEDVIPANTAVIIKAEEGKYTFIPSNETPDAIEGNLLRGTLTDTYIKPASAQTAYVLSKVDGVVGMYRAKLKADGTFKNNANRVYMLLGDINVGEGNLDTSNPGGQLSNGYRFDFSGTTAIEGIESEQGEAVYYDLSGRRVENPEKGIYIVNGRKVFIK